MKKRITLHEIWKTLHADLIGKDSHRGITLTYGWMANQIGHFSLGFIPTFLIFWNIDNSFKSFIYVALFWLTFEIYNALSPLYKKEYKGNGSFNPPWKNLLFDTFTDLCFFWTGSATFFLIVDFKPTVLVVFLIGLIVLFFFGRYWFLVKLYQQNAFYPFQFRLSQWNASIQTNYIRILKNFINEKPSNKHFIVLGSKGKGKTTLMVGLANEFSIQMKKGTYTTLSKWVSMLQEDDQTKGSISLWNWSTSDFLLIDDINPGLPIKSNKYLSNDVFEYIIETHPTRNMELLKNMNVAWVVGSCAEGEEKKDWVKMLEKIGINSTNIFVIDLDQI